MISIAYAAPHEREEVAQFMKTVFTKAKWDIEGWRKLVAGRWTGPDGQYAITVRDGKRLVGVLGLVYATRQTAAGPRVTADMSSWYILREYRAQGIGQRVLAFATADPNLTVNNFSSAQGAVSVLMNGGFQVLDRDRLIWRAGHNGAGLRVERDPLRADMPLAAEWRKIIVDHADLKLYPAVVETPDGALLLMIYPQKKQDDYVTHEAMYVSDHAVFAVHARAIAGAVLPPSGAILSLDRRFTAPGLEADEVHSFAAPRFYHSGVMAPADIDMLYSECLLLGNKIH